MKLATALVLSFLLLSFSTANGQSISARALEAEMQEFLDFSAAQMAPGSGITDEEKQEIRQNAAQLLLRADVLGQISYSTLNDLFKLARKELTAEQALTVAEGLTARKDSAASQNFTELQAFYLLRGGTSTYANRIQVRKECAQLVADWVNNQPNLAGMSLKDLTWCCQRLSLPQWHARSFSVLWEGQLEVPTTGEYVFSISPFDVNYEQSYESYRQSMKVIVDRKEVIDASPDAETWQHESQAMALTAGTRVALKVEYDYEMALHNTTIPGNPSQTDRSPVALLAWQGPGFEQTVIPANALLSPEGDAAGLSATYHLRHQGNAKRGYLPREVVETCSEPTIDHTWVGGQNFLCQDSVVTRRLSDELWGRVMTADYWKACNARANALVDGMTRKVRQENSHWLVGTPDISAFLNNSQRSEFLSAVTTHGTILEKLTPQDAQTVYTRYWFGAEDAAIVFLGEWMQAHTNVTPLLRGTAADFMKANRRPFRQLVIPTLLEYPEHYEVIQEEYLETATGECCLPAAYVLAYGHLFQGEITDWIALLDDKLAEESLSGDQRVNWLLARAHAEEIRHSSTGNDFEIPERLLAGQGWLDEASLIAESSEIQERIAKEKIARLAAYQQWDVVESELQSASPEISAWAANREQLEQKAGQQLRQAEQKAQAEYLAELRRRQQRASDRGDEQAVQRYTTKIESLEAN